MFFDDDVAMTMPYDDEAVRWRCSIMTLSTKRLDFKNLPVDWKLYSSLDIFDTNYSQQV